jgi:uncharacterized membrane protein YtjA (UPF0391 family)
VGLSFSKISNAPFGWAKILFYNLIIVFIK